MGGRGDAETLNRVFSRAYASGIETVRTNIHGAPAAGGVAVRDVLALQSLLGADVIAGETGLGKLVTAVNVMEVPDIEPYLAPGELLLTTGFPIRDNPDAIDGLIPILADKGLTALAIKQGRYLRVSPAMVRQADEAALPLLLLPQQASFNEILADVVGEITGRQKQRLEMSLSIHQELAAVMLDGGTFADLIRKLAELIDCPAALIDARGSVLAASADAVSLDPKDGVSRLAHLGPHDNGLVVVWPDAELPEDAAAAIHHVATIASLLTAPQALAVERDQRHRDAFLHGLLTGDITDTSVALAQATAFGWHLTGARAALIVEYTAEEEAPPFAGLGDAEQILFAVTSLAGPTVVARPMHHSVELIVDPRTELNVLGDALRELFESRLPGSTVSIGIGSPQADVGRIHRSHDEAAVALRVGHALHGSGFVVRYGDLGIYRLLARLDRDHLAQLCREALGPLATPTNEHSQMLLYTLECYLRNQGNKATTAAELYVHYNTLRYRLSQIEGLMGPIKDPPAKRLEIEVALHALHLLSGYPPQAGESHQGRLAKFISDRQ